MLKLKKWYINFLEKEKTSIFDKIIYFFLVLLSFLYAAIVSIRNFLYNVKIFTAYRCSRKVISLGNLSWSGSGKTTLALLLCQKLAAEFRIAVLRRGYGQDEEKLLREKSIEVFSSPDRNKLAKSLAQNYDLFVLDDGFQYRKLYRDINIIIMGARELRKKIRLLPAYFFREPLSSLARADILLINYKEEIDDISKITNKIKSNFTHLSLYTGTYHFIKIVDLKNNAIDLQLIKSKKLAAMTAIGYPEGFLKKLEETGIKVSKKIIYPDHYELTNEEFKSLQDDLISEEIYDVMITAKDKHHLPQVNQKINFYIFEIGLKIDEEKRFFEEIQTRLKQNVPIS